MQKTVYHKPTTEVVILQQRGQVMIVSEPSRASIQDYDWNTILEE